MTSVGYVKCSNILNSTCWACEWSTLCWACKGAMC